MLRVKTAPEQVFRQVSSAQPCVQPCTDQNWHRWVGADAHVGWRDAVWDGMRAGQASDAAHGPECPREAEHVMGLVVR